MELAYPTDKHSCGRKKSVLVKDKKNKINKNTDELVAADSNLLSLDCPAVAMRLEDVMKAKSPQVLEWHCQLC